MLGLLPGFGGTQRLPALVGMQNAMPMLMTGSNKKGPQAKKMKLVDQTCDGKQLMQCALVTRPRFAANVRACCAASHVTSHVTWVTSKPRDTNLAPGHHASRATALCRRGFALRNRRGPMRRHAPYPISPYAHAPCRAGAGVGPGPGRF